MCINNASSSFFVRWWWSKCCRSKRGELTGNRVSIPKAHNSTASPEIPLTKSAVVAVAGVARRAVQILWIRKCLLCSFFCFECLKPGHPYYKIFGGESKQRDRYASLLFLVLTLDSFKLLGVQFCVLLCCMHLEKHFNLAEKAWITTRIIPGPTKMQWLSKNICVCTLSSGVESLFTVSSFGPGVLFGTT